MAASDSKLYAGFFTKQHLATNLANKTLRFLAIHMKVTKDSQEICYFYAGFSAEIRI